VGVLDIENESGLVTMGARPAATDFAFPHVAHGNGSCVPPGMTGLILDSRNTIPVTAMLKITPAARHMRKTCRKSCSIL
jgi:hypothetical protein